MSDHITNNDPQDEVQNNPLLLKLNDILHTSRLVELQAHWKNTIRENMVAYRLKPNDFSLRAFELWVDQEGEYFRVYYSPLIDAIVPQSFLAINGQFRQMKDYTDFRSTDGDFLSITQSIYEIFSNTEITNTLRVNAVKSKNSRFAGLMLPDVEIKDCDQKFRPFNWREVIAIDEYKEDNSLTNPLKEVLSQKGIYLQRSKDGCSRYVGSACSDGGILSRWMKHLSSSGDASYLNLYVLENGYNAIEFCVLEFFDSTTDTQTILAAEKRWKETLGSYTKDKYNGFQLNNN